MKIAVVGGGIAGMGAAHQLQNHADVTIFEADRRLGGSVYTHAVLIGGRTYSFDSGCTVFHEQMFPHFSRWLDEVGVASEPANMSFGLRNSATGLEYGSRGLAALFCQRANLLQPRFWRMLLDLRRFLVNVRHLDSDGLTVADLVSRNEYSEDFIGNCLAPACSVQWLLSRQQIMQIPARAVADLVARQVSLQSVTRLPGDRAETSATTGWRCVVGGSQRYIDAFEAGFSGRIRCGAPVASVERGINQVIVNLVDEAETFDAVVMACHSDQALSLLTEPTHAERQILSAFTYRSSRVLVHSDPSVMPRNRMAWSSCNAAVAEQGTQVTFWINKLQSLGNDQPFFITHNPVAAVSQIWSEREYAYPVLTREARAAQSRRDEINGARSTYYCGAYWGLGSHEDGLRSGLDIAASLRGVGAVAA